MSNGEAVHRGEAFTFGPFELSGTRRELRLGGEPLRVGSRAMDILLAMVARPGEVISKGELTAAAWPRTNVEQSNLRVHMGALRKILSAGFDGRTCIQNVPGKGYLLAVPVRRLSESDLRR